MPRGSNNTPTPTHALKLRGSRLAKRRAAKPKAAPSMMKPQRMRPLRNLPELIRTLPGYDPFEQAGDCYFDEKQARRVIRFIETQLSHSKGELARQPFAMADWQRAVIANLFGWLRPDGTRRYRQAFLFIPRKNGKTAMAAAIIAYLLFQDGEAGAEIYGCASEYRQACLVFDHVRGMILQNDDLLARCTLYTGQAKAVQLDSDFSTYRCVSREASSAHGFNSSGYVIDELHALPDDELVEVLETSTGARRQPLGVLISTSDYEREGSPCNAKHDYASKVCDGIIGDPSFLPVIYEASIDDDWTDPKVWAKANPNLGVSVSEDYIRAACKKAQDSPRFLNSFLRLHLNIRTAQDTRWLDMARWDECNAGPLSLADFTGRECWAGLDLSSTRDMTALVFAFTDDDERFSLVPAFWIPHDNAVERERRDRVPYMQWVREGLIRETHGDAIDYQAIRRDINAIVDEHKLNVREIAVDRLFQGAQLSHELAEQDGFRVIAHGMGFLSMASPTQRFEELCVERKLRHGGNAVLRWHASNVSVETDAAGNIKPSRKKSTEKIDGIVAAIMAVGRAVQRSKKQNAYEGRSLLWV